MRGRISTYRELVAVARRQAPSVLLPVLSQISACQFLGRSSPSWPDPWLISVIARENIAYGNEHRGGPHVTDSDLRRAREVGLTLVDPFIDEVGQPDAMDSVLVRYVFQQASYQCDPFAEIARILAVLDRDYSSMTLEVVSDDWESLLGVPVEKFVKASFVILVCAQSAGGQFDPAVLADPTFESYGVTRAEVLAVFHRYFAAELSDLQKRARATVRHVDERLRHLDFNLLVETPYVGMGDGRYIAPSMHLAAQRISLASLYFIGMTQWKEAFSRDFGKIIEAYVGDQLRLLDSAVVTGERPYKIKKNSLMAADFVLKLDGLTVVFEVKSARVAHKARLAFDAYQADFQLDVNEALEKQIKTTVDLIRAENNVFADLQLPTEICGVVVTAEPHYMINSAAYRQRLPDPGCPFAVVSLGELERLIAAAQVGDSANLFRAVTRGDNVMNTIGQHTQRLGVEVEPNSLLDAAFSRLRVPSSSSLH
ncbi:MAG: hypothetical protein ACRDSL_21450 [Pseudonocardiaceae bacterium]